MAEEIKESIKELEILITALDGTERGEEHNAYTVKCIKNVINCITNLQQDLDKANDIIEKDRQFYKCRMDEYAELKKENKRLKEKINTLKSNFEVEIDDCENYKKWYRDYKSKCQKAIEYIENNKKETSSHFNGKEYVYRNFTLCCEPNDLLNILNGSDENE